MRKADPVVAVIRFFEDAPLDTVKTVFAICKDIVQRRLPAKTKPRAIKPAAVVEKVG